MVAAEQEEILGEFQFDGEQKKNRLEAPLSTVDVVAQEEIIGRRRPACL